MSSPLSLLANCVITIPDLSSTTTPDPITGNPVRAGNIELTCYLKRVKLKPDLEVRAGKAQMNGYIIQPFPYEELLPYNQNCKIRWLLYGQNNIAGEFLFQPEPTVAGLLVEPITGRRISGWYTIKN